MSIMAHFIGNDVVIDQFEVIANDDGYGTTTGSGTYYDGTTAILTATTNQCFKFEK